MKKLSKVKSYNTFVSLPFRIGMWLVLLCYEALLIYLANAGAGTVSAGFFNMASVSVSMLSIFIFGMADAYMFRGLYRADAITAEVFKTSALGKRFFYNVIHMDLLTRFLWYVAVNLICPLPVVLMKSGKGEMYSFIIMGAYAAIAAFSMNMAAILISRLSKSLTFIIPMQYVPTLGMLPALYSMFGNIVVGDILKRPVFYILYAIYFVLMITFGLLHLHKTGQLVDIKWFFDDMEAAKQ